MAVRTTFKMTSRAEATLALCVPSTPVLEATKAGLGRWTWAGATGRIDGGLGPAGPGQRTVGGSGSMNDQPWRRRPWRRAARIAGLALGPWLGAAVVVGVAADGRAQVIVQREDFIPVLDRPHPEWSPLGLSVGQFLVLPRLSAGVEYDDNILDTPTAGLKDAIYQINPDLTVLSNWDQNEVDLSASATLNRYNRYSSQDTDQYTVSGAGVLNVRHDLTIGLQAFNLQAEIPRSSDAYVFGSLIPLLYDQTFSRISLQKTFINFQLTADLTYEVYSYTNGLAATLNNNIVTDTPINESFRNRNTAIAFLRGDYTLSPSFEIFAEERAANSLYPDTTGRNQVTTETLVGPNVELGHVIQAEFGVGLLTNEVANPQAKAVRAADWLAQVIYLPTPLLTLSLIANQHIVDSGLPDAPAFLLKDVGFETDYELMRNLIVVGKISGLWYDYQGIVRQDRYLNASLGATYYLNRLIGINLVYAHAQRISNGSTTILGFNNVPAAIYGFDTNTLSLTIVFQR